MVRPILIDYLGLIYHAELNYCSFMICLSKFTGCCNVLSPKICVPKETKDISVKAFIMITSKDEAKAMTEHISCDYKCKLNSATCNSNLKWNKIT